MTPKQKYLNRIVFILSIIGVFVAIYVLQSFLRHTGIVCVTGGCEAVRKNPASWPFGIPVPAVGLVGYAILTICAFLRTLTLPPKTLRIISGIMMGMATFGVLFVTWFTYTELFVIHGVCTWCLLSTIIMYVVFALLLIASKLKT